MKRDPHKSPIPLTGQWEFNVARRKMPLKGSFWHVASNLMRYRMANHMPNSGFEQCQMEVLLAKRKAMGLTTELAEQSPGQAQQSRVQQFLNRHKKKGGCGACGKKR